MLTRRDTVCCVLWLAATACLPIPHTHMKQPAATFVIRNAEGRAVPAAQVTIYGGSAAGDGVRLKSTVTADSAGRAAIPRHQDWHWFVLLVPDAEAGGHWTWCAAAQGYRPTVGRLVDEPQDTLHVVLSAASAGTVCPASPATTSDVLKVSAAPFPANARR